MYTNEETRHRCENYRGIALGNSAYKILSNIILGKITPYIEKVMGDYQNGFRDGRSVIDNIFALKIINEKLWGIIRVYNIYFLTFKRHMTLYIEIPYGNVWKNLEFLLN